MIPVAEIMYGFCAGVGSGPSNECNEDTECKDTECPEDDECCCDEASADADAAEADECCCDEASADADATEADECCCDEASAGADAAEAATGAGVGAGARARPIACIVVGPEGVHVQPIVDEQKVSLAGILLGFWAIGWVGLVLKTLFTRRS